MPLHEPEEFAVLIGHAADGDRDVPSGHVSSVSYCGPADAALVGNRIAVRVGCGPAEHLVDPFDEPIGHGVLEVLGLVVHLRPAHPHHLHEEQLDQPMAPHHQRRKPVAAAVSRTPAYGSYRTRPDSASALTMVVAVPGATPSAEASWPIGTSRSAAGAALAWKIGFQVVFDGAEAGQHLTYQMTYENCYILSSQKR